MWEAIILVLEILLQMSPVVILWQLYLFFFFKVNTCQIVLHEFQQERHDFVVVNSGQ